MENSWKSKFFWYPGWYGLVVYVGAENFAFLRETDDTETETETDDTVKNAICKCFGKTGFSNLHYK